MFKRGMMLFASLVTFFSLGSTCRAEILPAYGPGQIGYTAVVLCDSLSVRQERSSASEAVKTLHHGDRMMVLSQKDGWAECCLSDDVDASPDGWVNADYIVIDPSWYKADDYTTVYAWNDTKANKIARIDKGTVLPILKDDGQWLVVGLRGASGWIRKSDSDQTSAASAQKSSGTSVQNQNTAASESAAEASEEAEYFTVYAADGSTSDIRLAGGAMYEDENGRTYVNQESGVYYCIVTDVTYYSDPDAWDDQESSDYGDSDEYTGADYGEGAGLENNWEDEEDDENIGAYYGEGAGLENNWEDYE